MTTNRLLGSIVHTVSGGIKTTSQMRNSGKVSNYGPLPKYSCRRPHRGGEQHPRMVNRALVDRSQGVRHRTETACHSGGDSSVV
jgi:hypothetical protein